MSKVVETLDQAERELRGLLIDRGMTEDGAKEIARNARTRIMVSEGGEVRALGPSGLLLGRPQGGHAPSELAAMLYSSAPGDVKRHVEPTEEAIEAKRRDPMFRGIL